MFMHGVCAALRGSDISPPAWHLTACRQGQRESKTSKPDGPHVECHAGFLLVENSR